jgi:N-acetylmuramic acid 6-phosphate etherase
MNFTESSSGYNGLEKMSVGELLTHINNEDKTVPAAVEKAIPQIGKLIEQIVPRLKGGGRLFYLGAGTSGRLGIVDASECPPTFGVSYDLVIGIIAGGETAIRKAVEFAEDDMHQGWQDLLSFNVNQNDVVVGITASGTTPYVAGALEQCRKQGILTGCITCNPDTPVAAHSDFPVEVITGPEFVSGSTRMKAGTAQKLVLNMLSTSIMIQMGRVKGNKMVDMQLSNNKLVNRGVDMLMQELDINREEAALLLDQHKNVRKAIDWYKNHA